MTSMANMKQAEPLRILAVGHPGTGKTGALAALANAGYRLRVLDFDGNCQPLFQFIDKKWWGSVEIVSLEDTMADTGAGPIGIKGTPKAFTQALNLLLKSWAYTGRDGKPVDLGPITSWTPRDVVVLDSLTAMGECAMARALAMAGRSVLNRRRQDWGVAAAEQNALLSIITQTAVPCHVYVTSHLKMLGTPDIKEEEPEELTEMRIKKAAVLADKLFPTAIGQQLPQYVAGHFNVTLEFLTTFAPGSTTGKRIIRTVPSPAVDVKLPATDLPPTLPLDTGLATIFQRLNPEGANYGRQVQEKGRPERR